jgi:hypothetical protein
VPEADFAGVIVNRALLISMIWPSAAVIGLAIETLGVDNARISVRCYPVRYPEARQPICLWS